MSSPFIKWGKPRVQAQDSGSPTEQKGSAAGIDWLLKPYLESNDLQQAERLLAALVDQCIKPTIAATLRQRHLTAEEAGEIAGSIAITLIERIRQERREKPHSGSAPPIIHHLEGYVAVVTHHAVDGWLRERSPGRARLRRGVRYVLLHSPLFALWQQEGTTVGGHADMQTQRRKVSPLSHEDLVRRCVLSGNPQTISLVTLIDALLKTADAPLPLETLLAAVALLRGVEDHPADIEISTLSTGASLESGLFHRETLTEVWREVQQLSARQCAALLLNLRDNEGRGVLELLLALGITDRKGIAAALGWTLIELERVWEMLPVDDNQIAQWLGATRQQVINLRKVARERLERRMRRSEGELE